MSLRSKLSALCLIGLLLPLVVLGWSRLRLETDILATLPNDLPEVQALRLLRDGFSGGTDLLVTLAGADPAGVEEAVKTTAQRLRERPDLVSAVAWQSPLESQMGDAAGVVAWMLANAAPEQLAQLRARLEGPAARQRLEDAVRVAAESPEIEQVQRAGYDPFGLLDGVDLDALGGWQPSLLGQGSEDGRFRLLIITPALELAGYKASAAWLEAIRAEVAQVCEERSVKARYTGEPAFQAEIGAGIEKDLSSTLGMTELLIALLFWVLFRRLKPLLWIQLLLVLSLVITLGLGGLLVGQLSIMSLGFAAIVLGIIVDYAVLILQEGRTHPELDAATLRRRSAPGIAAGAAATAVVFLSLVFGGLPGLAELGLLVALGVLTGLVVMLGFAPPFSTGSGNGAPSLPEAPPAAPAPAAGRSGLIGSGVLLAVFLAVFLLHGLPPVDTSSKALRPSQSESMAALDELQARLRQDDEVSLPLVVRGPTTELRSRAEAAAAALGQAVKTGTLVGFTLPAALTLNPPALEANETPLQWLIQQQPRLEALLEEAGFTSEAGELLRGVCAAWRDGIHRIAPPPSANPPTARQLLERFLVVDGQPRAQAAGLAPGEAAVLGEVRIRREGGSPTMDAGAIDVLQQTLAPLAGVSLAGWETLGTRLSAQVRAGLAWQLLPILGLILVTLWVTLRSVTDTLLSLLALLFGLAGLVTTLRLTGQTWNLANLASLPLLLGTGIDYAIHMLLALQRSGNQVAHVRRTTGRAVFFSGMTTVIGFGSLAFAGNQGIASLGWVCSLGSLWILLGVLWLLPCWRVWACRAPQNAS